MAGSHGIIFVVLVFLEKLSWTTSKVSLTDANVTCIIQDDCILPCSFRPTGTVVIHWYKQQIPVHSYYYNKDQFGLQNKHFSGRTCLFNSHIPHGNASLLLRRVKVQDKGRYKCYTSTRKGNQEMFVNLEVKALIQSVVMEVTDDTVTCSSHNVYPVPQVTWATDPPSAQETVKETIVKTTDHKGLFTVESMLRIVGNFSSYTYFCSFISADRSQVWTASWKNQENITQEEGHAVSIPCMAPHSFQNFSLAWTFSSCSEPTLILRYDNRSRHMVNLWVGQAELDPDLLLQGDGSLLLNKPDSEEHSGTYTCTFSGSQSRHTVRAAVNITAASKSVDEQSVKRSWWSSAASAAFVLFTIVVALPQCVRQRATGTRTASRRYNGAGLVEGGLELHKDLNPSASQCHAEQCGAESDGQQLQLEAPGTAKDGDATPPPQCEVKRVQKLAAALEEGNDGSQSCDPGKDGADNNELYSHSYKKRSEDVFQFQDHRYR